MLKRIKRGVGKMQKAPKRIIIINARFSGRDLLESVLTTKNVNWENLLQFLKFKRKRKYKLKPIKRYIPYLEITRKESHFPFSWILRRKTLA
jgi:hypothetical protein